MVFQHYALFPHLTVEENIAFGLRYKGIAAADEGRRVADALALVQLSGFEKRLPHQLSGGQRQRVALARALALEPEVLLLDEPLGALDQKLRKEVQVQLKHLQRALGITFIFVTHDQEEALTMSDRIAVMNRGRVEQVDEAARGLRAAGDRVRGELHGRVELLRRPRARGGRRDSSRWRWRPAESVAAARRTARATGRARRCGSSCGPEKLDLRGRDLSAHGVPSLPVTVEDRVYQGVITVWIVRDAAGRALRRLRAEREAVRGGVAVRGRRPRLPVLEPAARRDDPRRRRATP